MLGKQPLYPKTRGKCTEHRGVEPRTELTKNRIRPRQQGSRLSSYQYPRYLTWLSRGTSSLTRLFSNRRFFLYGCKTITVFQVYVSVHTPHSAVNSATSLLWLKRSILATSQDNHSQGLYVGLLFSEKQVIPNFQYILGNFSYPPLPRAHTSFPRVLLGTHAT